MTKLLPACHFLPPDDIGRIDRTGRRVLSDVGMRIRDAETLDILKAAGAQVDKDAAIVRFPAEVLSELLASAPSQFELFSRDGLNDLLLGSEETYFSNGGRVFRILDLGTGGYRLTMLRDVAHTAALVEHSAHIKLFIIPCQAHDVAPEYYHLNDFYHAFNHTTKHVMGGCDNLEGAKQMFALASLIAGGKAQLREKPFVSVITNPVSPLTIDPEALRVFRFCCKNGIPTTCAPAPITGATAPGTLAGTLAQSHAEALGGVAIAQAIAPGAKVLYGAVPSTMDLRTMDYTMGSVEMAMMNAAAVQLAKYYQLPIYASGGVTEAKRPDIQAGCEKTFSNLLVALNGADLIHLASGMLDSGSSISYEQYIIDNEILGMIRRIIDGINVNDETLAYRTIKDIGPGGNYVLEQHTIDHMMSEFFYPELAVRCNFDIWEKKDRPSMLSRAGDVVNQILNEGPEGLLPSDLIVDIKEAFPGIQSL